MNMYFIFLPLGKSSYLILEQDIYYNLFNISRYLFIIIFLVTLFSLYFYKATKIYNFNNVTSINNFNIDLQINKLFIY